jgi:Zn-dependent peptidase ImmA (M78 family)
MTVRRRKIRFLAKELLAQANAGEAPVPVAEIARGQGLELRFSRSPDSTISGLLFLSDDKPIIGVNVTHHENRQRFTIAHELGHYLLHAFSPQALHVDHSFRVMLRDDLSSEGTDMREIEANLFAAELLMPTEFLNQDLQGKRQVDIEDDDFLRELARRYRVSHQAMVFRLTNLGYLAL